MAMQCTAPNTLRMQRLVPSLPARRVAVAQRIGSPFADCTLARGAVAARAARAVRVAALSHGDLDREKGRSFRRTVSGWGKQLWCKMRSAATAWAVQRVLQSRRPVGLDCSRLCAALSSHDPFCSTPTET